MTVFPFDITDTGFRHDPYPTYDYLRENDPVHYRLPKDDFVLTRHVDVLSVLRDERFGYPTLSADLFEGPREGRGLGAGAFRTVGSRQRARQLQLSWMLFKNPPDHTVLRGLFQDSFAPTQAEGWRAGVQAVADELVAGVEGRDQIDIVRDLAFPLPAMVIADVFGLPRRDWATFRAWIRDLVPTLDEHAGTMAGDDARRAILGITEYFHEVIRQRQRHPEPDLFTKVLDAARAVGVSHDDLVANVALVFVAGQETVQHLIGNGLMALWDHPDQARLLRDDPSLLRSAVEEMARFDSPVQLTSREAMVNVEVGGTTIRRGQTVRLSIGAANRDPAKFADAGSLDVARSPNPHLTFSGGPHVCLGGALARMEAQAMLGAILRRYPDVRLAPGPAPERFPHFAIRGYRSLPVVLEPSKAAVNR